MCTEGAQVVRDGWWETVNLPRGDLEMAHTVAKHNDGEVAAGDIDAPFPPGIWCLTTSRIAAKWSAPKRRVREKFGWAIHRVGDRRLYIRGFSGCSSAARTYRF